MPKTSNDKSLPKNWPADIPYLTISTLSPRLPAAHISAVRTQPQDTSIYKLPKSHSRGPCSAVKITPITQVTHPGHPAIGQSGLFATKHLKPDEFILCYHGVIHSSLITASTISDSTKQTTDPHAKSNYDLSLDRLLGIGIDAATCGNEARFINDYRGVPGKSRPNAEFREVWDERVGMRGIGVFVIKGGGGRKAKDDVMGKAFKGIEKGEEVLVSYGRGFWAGRGGKDGGYGGLKEDGDAGEYPDAVYGSDEHG